MSRSINSKSCSLSLSKGISTWITMVKYITALFTLFIVAIIILADRGALPEPIKIMYAFSWGDKVGHFILMGVLTFLVNLSISAKKIKLFSRPVFLGSLLVALAVVLEELSQIFISTRSFSLLDLSADFLGIACSSWLLTRLWLSKSKPAQ
jgi:polysaccharide biosynthesis protein VpsQ